MGGGGGLMQLVAYGAHDIFLSGTPKITFFKMKYRRHTNFAPTSLTEVINDNLSPNNQSIIITLDSISQVSIKHLHESCSICLNGLNENKLLIFCTMCRHYFHKACINDIVKNECPNKLTLISLRSAHCIRILLNDIKNTDTLDLTKIDF